MDAKPTIGLAPMEGVTEFSARLWFWLCSAPDFLWTPFLRVTDSFPNQKLPDDFAPEITCNSFDAPYPLKLQYMSSESEQFLRAFEAVSDLINVIDLNCGCPSPKVVGNGAGSSLLADPQQFHRTLERLVAAVGEDRLSVKMRLGYNHESEFFDLFAPIQNFKLAHLTIHGRTRVDRYTGKARWSFAEQAARLTHYPIIGSGDICCYQHLLERRQDSPSVQTMIIGRGAMRNPWIFSELRQQKSVTIECQALIYALASFCLLEEASHTAFENLLRAACEGEFHDSIGTDYAAWRKNYELLCKILGVPKSNPIEIKISRKSLGRLKMIWNYLRSSLPEAFFDPTILRSGSEGELLARIATLGSTHPTLTLQYNESKDWVYSGGKIPIAPNAQGHTHFLATQN